MSAEAKFVDGLRVYAPKQGAPSFIIANLVVNVAELREWLSERTENEVRIDIKQSRGGKYYASENDYRPDSQRPAQSQRPARQPTPEPTGGFADDDLDSVPF